MQGLWRLLNWIMILAYLNILWILFSLLGLIVFGVGPATVSVFTLIRSHLNNDYRSSIWRVFRQSFQENFWNANKFMLIIVPAVCIVYIDFVFLRMLPNSFFIDNIVFTCMIVLSLLLIILFSYLFAVYVHFDLLFFENFKYAILIAGINPLPATLMLIGLFITFIIFLLIPAMSVFYLISLPAFIIQLCAQQSFKKISHPKNSKV